MRCFSKVRPERLKKRAASGVLRKRGGRPARGSGMSAVPWSIRRPSNIGDGVWPRWRKRIGGTDDGVGGLRPRHPRHGPQEQSAAVSKVRSVAAQQAAVSAAHHADGVLDEADRLAADRGGLPGVAGNRLGTIERVRGLAVARLGEMAVERPDHQDGTPAMPPGDQPCFRRRTGDATRETPLEADQAENAKPEMVVQWQQGGEPLAFARSGKPNTMVA